MSKDIETFGKWPLLNLINLIGNTLSLTSIALFQKDHIQLNDAGKVSNLKAGQQSL